MDEGFEHHQRDANVINQREGAHKYTGTMEQQRLVSDFDKF